MEANGPHLMKQESQVIAFDIIIWIYIVEYAKNLVEFDFWTARQNHSLLFKADIVIFHV